MKGRKVVFVWLHCKPDESSASKYSDEYNYGNSNEEWIKSYPVKLFSFSVSFDVKTGKFSDFKATDYFEAPSWDQEI
jgi:hypothetical protein